MNGIKVCLFCPVHVADDVRVFNKYAKSLVSTGYEVELICNSEEKKISSDLKITSSFSYNKSRLIRIVFNLFNFRRLMQSKARVYHCHNPDTLLLALILHALGKCVIYETHEDFTKRILTRSWIPAIFRSFLSKTIGSAERWLVSRIDAGIATQEDVKDRLGENAIVVYNSPVVDCDSIDAILRKGRERRKDDIFRLVYVGGISIDRGLLEMVEALPSINAKYPCRLYLVGPVDPDERSAAERLEGWRYVDYVPRVPQAEAFEYVAMSDVGLVYLRDVAGYSMTDPNKIYEYMAYERPFIASNFDRWRNRFSETNAGVFIEPGHADLLSQAVIELIEKDRENLREMGKRGRAWVERNSWDREFEKVERLYERILSD